jgi:hypothetical protein
MTKLNAKDAIEKIRKLLFTDGSQSSGASTGGNSYSLKDGTPIKIMGSLEPGVQVFIITPNGDQPAPDGELELYDGTVLNITGGLITEVETAGQATSEQGSSTSPGEAQFSAADFESKLAEIEKEVAAIKEVFSRHDTANKELIDLVGRLAELPVEGPVSKPKNAFSEIRGRQESNLKHLADSLQKLKSSQQ